MKILLFLSLFVFSLYAVDGRDVYEKNCAKCHIDMISKAETLKNFSTLKAPPMIEVANRLKNYIQITEDDEDMHRAVVIAFIKYYITKPDITYSMCDPMAIEKFGQMPSLKGKITEEESEAVAAWIYDHYEEKEFR